MEKVNMEAIFYIECENRGGTWSEIAREYSLGEATTRVQRLCNDEAYDFTYCDLRIVKAWKLKG
ncbi:hypothetical protein Y842_09995 [Listeria monocytogenes]|nr:hypothetical protein [Listeria monocytogenes]